jgi:hypothetical protein
MRAGPNCFAPVFKHCVNAVPERPGFFRETASDQVMERVDQQGNLLGFSVLKVSTLRGTPLEVVL